MLIRCDYCGLHRSVSVFVEGHLFNYKVILENGGQHWACGQFYGIVYTQTIAMPALTASAVMMAAI